MPTIGVYQLSDLTHTGTDPWPSGADAEPDAVGGTTFVLDVGATPIQVEIDDNDLNLNDGDGNQNFGADATVNGTDYSAGDTFENEYSYAIRPVGSTDPGDIITVYAIDEGGATPTFAIATTDPLVPGVEYEFVSVDSDSPSVAYTDLFVCFATGTRISTLNGDVPVESLHPGDLLLTLDSGPQPLVWTGRRRLVFDDNNAAQRPILLRQGAISPDLPWRDLRLSPQHRLMIRTGGTEVPGPQNDGLAACVSFDGQPFVRRMNGCREITYHTLLLPRHEIILAEGVPVESLYPTEYALSLLTGMQRLQVHAALPWLTRDVRASYGEPARPLIPTKDAKTLPLISPVDMVEPGCGARPVPANQQHCRSALVRPAKRLSAA